MHQGQQKHHKFWYELSLGYSAPYTENRNISCTLLTLQEEALRLYQITDDPDNFYLTKTLDQCECIKAFFYIIAYSCETMCIDVTHLSFVVSERRLEADEMPLQFPNRNKKAMLFLRIKVGLINVYLMCAPGFFTIINYMLSWSSFQFFLSF